MSVSDGRRREGRLRKRLEAVEARTAGVESGVMALVEDLVAAEAHIADLKAQLAAHAADKKGHHG